MKFNLHKKEEEKSQKCNLEKEKSITDRLDNTEALLKKINKKFDIIFKDGPKINIDIGKIKKGKRKGKGKGKKTLINNSSTHKIKYNDKVKNLIQKIIKNRTDRKENTNSSCTSPEISESSN